MAAPSVRAGIVADVGTFGLGLTDPVTMTVDGSAPRSIKGLTGTISNAFPLSIGGKVSCNQTTVSCDTATG